MHEKLTMADNARKRPADAIDLTEEASPQEKKQKAALADIAKEFICPITQELPFDPVIAKDGKIYERNAILEWFRKKDGDATSPSTGKVIDTELVPAVQVRNTIESLIKSGAIEGEAAEAWRRSSSSEKEVKEIRAKAEGGDGYSMWRLGVRYRQECWASRKTPSRPAHGTSAARRSATQWGWRLLVNFSCMELVVPLIRRSGSFSLPRRRQQTARTLPRIHLAKRFSMAISA